MSIGNRNGGCSGDETECNNLLVLFYLILGLLGAGVVWLLTS